MKLPVIRESYFINSFILIGSLLLSIYCLLFGISHLVELKFDNINLDSIVGIVICLVLCIAGISFLAIAIASAKGIIYMLKSKKPFTNS